MTFNEICFWILLHHMYLRAVSIVVPISKVEFWLLSCCMALSDLFSDLHCSLADSHIHCAGSGYPEHFFE